MKLIRARASRAPAPDRTEKRAPDMRAARSKSRMPSAPPISQWGFGAKSNVRGVPHRRTSTLSADEAPTGTLWCGRLGSVSSSAWRRASIASSSASCSLMRRARSLFAWNSGVGSRPARRAIATCADASFDSRFNVSTIGMSRRRSASSRVSSASSVEGSMPRDRSRVSTPAGSSRRSAGSNMAIHAIPPRPPCDTMHDVATAKQQVRKAVFPAAGLGTRFLPATKAQPKEMLPLVDKPIIQYGIEEAAAAGIEDIVIVTGRGKNAIEDHFDVSVELETFLEARGKQDQAAEIRSISRSLAYVRQGEPLGLGHAVLTARPLVGDNAFAVILADDVIDATPGALAQMIEVFNEVDGPVLLVERVPREQISGYGVIAYEPVREGVYRVTDLVEKPKPEDAPSELAIIGRYVLTPDIFAALVEEAAAVRSGKVQGEIQLTNGLRRLLARRNVYACEIEGVRHDTGNKLGFLKAVVYFALKRPDLAGPLRAYLEAVVG